MDEYELIRYNEGYRPDAYWDQNAWRVGYGSDTYVDSDGKRRKVTKNTAGVTKDQAEADLQYRVPRFQQSGILSYVNSDAWNNLPTSAKAAVTSVAYNYGSLKNLKTLRNAIDSGDPTAVADAIDGYGSHNGGINQKRRKFEADVIRGDATIPPGYVPTVATQLDLGKMAPVPKKRSDGTVARTRAALGLGASAQTTADATNSLLDTLRPIPAPRAQGTAARANAALTATAPKIAPTPASVEDRVTARNRLAVTQMPSGVQLPPIATRAQSNAVRTNQALNDTGAALEAQNYPGITHGNPSSKVMPMPRSMGTAARANAALNAQTVQHAEDSLLESIQMVADTGLAITDSIRSHAPMPADLATQMRAREKARKQAEATVAVKKASQGPLTQTIITPTQANRRNPMSNGQGAPAKPAPTSSRATPAGYSSIGNGAIQSNDTGGVYYTRNLPGGH